MAEIKELDVAGIDFLIEREGLVLHPYLDTVGVPTIGVGSTYYENGEKVTMADPAITKERAIELFRATLKHYEKTVYSVTRDDITQNEFNALVSLCYNIGVNGFRGSTVVRKVNENAPKEVIETAWLMWNKPKEILGRRRHEIKLYFS